MVDVIFLDIGIIIIIATIAAFLARKYKQPLIPAYIFAGLLIGPIFQYFLSLDSFITFFNIPPGLRIISDMHYINTLSEIGIAFLLFIVGLEIDLKKLKDVDKVSTIGGIIQILLVFSIGFIVASLMFFNSMEAIYVGFIVAFSSTMFVLKMLSDKKEIDTLHGRIIMGMLLIQDLIAIIALIILHSVGNFVGSNSFIFWKLSASILGAATLFLISIFLSKFVFPKLFRYAADSREFFFLLSLSICFTFSLLFLKIGFSIAIGAFVAGVSLGNLPYNIEIVGRVKSLRDFFATMFFVSLGLQLPFDSLRGIFLPLFILTLIVLIVKTLIFLIIIGYFGYKKRTSFLTSISLAQVSEFSLILVSQGLILGHVSQKLFTITIFLTITTFALSSYFIQFEYKLYTWLSKDLSFFEKINTHEENLEYIPEKDKHEVLLFGYDRTGYSVFNKLIKLKHNFMVIDFNPEIIKKLIKEKIPCIYGDAGNIEILEKVEFKDIKYIISTIPEFSTSKLIIKKAKKANPNVVIFVTCYQVDDALSLYDNGADYVILPHFLGGHHASVLLEEASKDITKIMKRKIQHIKELNHRKEMGHEHPRDHSK